MAPHATKSRRTQTKQHHIRSKLKQTSMELSPIHAATSSKKPAKTGNKSGDVGGGGGGGGADISGCSTPKAQRFRIPEILSCPPAPKKQRVAANCSFQRSPIAFYAPPDIELFFFFALRNISA